MDYFSLHGGDLIGVCPFSLYGFSGFGEGPWPHLSGSTVGYCGRMGYWPCCFGLCSAYITGVTAVFVYLELSWVRFRWVMDSTEVALCPCPICDINGQDRFWNLCLCLVFGQKAVDWQLQLECEMDMQFCVASAVLQALPQTVVLKR